MPGANQVIDNVRGGSIAAGAAEPFAAGQASDDAARVVNAAVAGIC